MNKYTEKNSYKSSKWAKNSLDRAAADQGSQASAAITAFVITTTILITRWTRYSAAIGSWQLGCTARTSSWEQMASRPLVTDSTDPICRLRITMRLTATPWSAEPTPPWCKWPATNSATQCRYHCTDNRTPWEQGELVQASREGMGSRISTSLWMTPSSKWCSRIIRFATKLEMPSPLEASSNMECLAVSRRDQADRTRWGRISSSSINRLMQPAKTHKVLSKARW